MPAESQLLQSYSVVCRLIMLGRVVCEGVAANCLFVIHPYHYFNISLCRHTKLTEETVIYVFCFIYDNYACKIEQHKISVSYMGNVECFPGTVRIFRKCLTFFQREKLAASEKKSPALYKLFGRPSQTVTKSRYS